MEVIRGIHSALEKNATCAKKFVESAHCPRERVVQTDVFTAYLKNSVTKLVDPDPLAIETGKSQQVKLRSFSTDVHRIEAMVAYRYEG